MPTRLYTRKTYSFTDVLGQLSNPFETELSRRMGSMMDNQFATDTGAPVIIAEELMDVQPGVALNQSMVTRVLTGHVNVLKKPPKSDDNPTPPPLWVNKDPATPYDLTAKLQHRQKRSRHRLNPADQPLHQHRQRRHPLYYKRKIPVVSESNMGESFQGCSKTCATTCSAPA
ncbi:MAG: hypothetical protein R2857_01170 [Vampirovibrionales bacterium]